MSKASLASSAQTNSPSLQESLKEKKLWVAVAGVVLTLVSSLATWLTVSVTLTGPSTQFFSPTLTVVISGYDATWNVTYAPLGIRIIYFQLLSGAIAFLTILLGIFRMMPSRTTRGYLLILGGIVGVLAPVEFAYAVIGQGQTLNAQFQRLSPLIGSLVQPNYNFTIGTGLVLGLLGPILWIVSGAIVFVEQLRKPKPSPVQVRAFE
jgi:hypothetical protein